jgi:hypothetical protein
MSVAIDTADVDAQKEAFDAECTTETDDDRPIVTGTCNDEPFCLTYSGTY